MKLWSGTADERRLYAQKSLIFDAAELVAEALEERGWTRKQLADALKVRASEITQRLRGKRNLTLRSLADMLHVMDYEVRLSKLDLGSPATQSRPITTTATRVILYYDDDLIQAPSLIMSNVRSAAGPGRVEVTNPLASVGRR